MVRQKDRQAQDSQCDH